jgi:hypothetical protein
VSRRIIAALSIATAVGGGIAVPVMTAASSTAAAGVCVHLSLNVNGTAHEINECLPPAS